jgi:hypothetical protein
MIVGSMRTVPNGIQIIKDDPSYQPSTPGGSLPFGMAERPNTAFEEQGKDTSQLHLILDMTRIGGNLFGVKMEYTYFPPRSGKNHLFNLVLMRWPSNGIMWSILSFPIEFKPQAEEIAKECGLRLADGVPHVFDNKGAHVFPLEGETVFTLENIHNHQVYSNDPQKHQRLKQEELAACDAILKADTAKLRQEYLAKGYTNKQIDEMLSHWEMGDEAFELPPMFVKDGSHKHGSPS